MKYTIETYHGSECKVYGHEIASLRIQVFREYPYLYDGNYEYELEYLTTFFSSKDSILLVAKQNNVIIGISTGIPLKNETDNIKTPWKQKGFNIDKIFYFGESVIEKKHRGNGLGKLFFKYREAWAAKNGYTTFSFCSINRSKAKAPDNYFNPESLWKKLGYNQADFSCSIDWKEINEPEETPKKLQFWYKEL